MRLIYVAAGEVIFSCLFIVATLVFCEVLIAL